MRVPGLGRLRWGMRSVTTNLFVPRAIMLLYHRVTELESDPQLLSVSRKHFAEHLEVVRKVGEPTRLIALDESFDGKAGRPRVVLTFDDGYADNLHHAKPLLERYDVPATVFVASNYVKVQNEFWQDELDKIFLQPGEVPRTLQFDINGRSYDFELGKSSRYDQQTYDKHRNWSVSRKDDPTARHGVYRALFDLLFPLSVQERQKQLNHLLAWAGMGSAARPTHRPLSRSEVIQLAAGGLVEVGSHTVNHPVLSRIPQREQAVEISGSKAHLEEILGSPVTSFAYPYGGRTHYTDETVAAVRDAGFKRACSNFSGIVRRRTDPWQLPRFLVRDWPGDEFMARLRGWLREM